MKIKIEEVKKGDINSIVKLQMRLADYHKEIDPRYYRSGKESEKQRRERLKGYFSKKRKNTKILVAKVNGKITGFLKGAIHKLHLYCREERMGEISQLYIDEKFRRKRIGKLLFEELLKWFKKRKIKFIEVQVDSKNKIAIVAYKKYGFFEFQKRMKLDL